MKKYYRGINKYISIFILICALPFLCGIGPFGAGKVTLDTEEHIVYQNIDANTMADEFSQNRSSAKDKYDDEFYLLYGKVISIKDNSKEIVIAQSGKVIITCETSDKPIIEEIKSLCLKSGDGVRVYGKVDADFIGYGVDIDIDKVEKSNSSGISNTVYSTKDKGISYDFNSLSKKTIPNSSISFYIPPEWENVEHNIKTEELGSLDGYQYRLNYLEPKKAYSESFFVCYFDKKYVNQNDRDKNKLIEEAIIRDIFKQDNVKNKFPYKKVKTYYGKNYIYYSDTFTKGSDKYEAELIFQEEKDGIVIYLYINYPGEADHIDDIMFTMRFLESNLQ